MKKLLLTLLAIILTVIIFTECGPQQPENLDQFDLGDTVDIRVGETLYESDSIWIRLDSITEDTRIPCCLDIVDTGYVVTYFSFGLNDTIHQSPFYFNYRAGGVITENYGFMPTPYYQLNMGMNFHFLMINVSPAKCNDENFEQWQYKISFIIHAQEIWLHK